jgi:hypothetical protein
LLAAVVEGTVELKYKIELFMANMDDGPPSSISKADRLKLLRAHQTAWKNLTWTKKSVVSDNPNATDHEDDEVPWKCLGGVLGQASSRSLHFIRVPSVFRGIEEKEWTVEDIGFRVGDFTMDPSQDLLVALEVETYVDYLSVMRIFVLTFPVASETFVESTCAPCQTGNLILLFRGHSYHLNPYRMLLTILSRFFPLILLSYVAHSQMV